MRAPAGVPAAYGQDAARLLALEARREPRGSTVHGWSRRRLPVLVWMRGGPAVRTENQEADRRPDARIETATGLRGVCAAVIVEPWGRTTCRGSSG
jgi:hypothetical protein